MFYDEHTAEIRRGSFRRNGSTWRLKSKQVCTHCKRHVVLAGASECPKCSARIGYCEVVPREHTKAMKKVKYSRWPKREPQGLYPSATPRRFPSSGQPPTFKFKKKK